MKLFQKAAEKLEKEYQLFLDYLELNEVQLSKRTGHIGKKDCFALNGLFDIVQEKYLTYGRTQDYYTVIDFFYFFSIRAGILKIVSKKGKGMTVQKGQRYPIFFHMSAMERYILMMTIWLGEYQQALGDFRSSFMRNGIFEVIRGAREEEALQDPFRGRIASPWGSYYIPEIRLFALFQLLRIQWLEDKEENKDNKFRIKTLYLTEEGYAWKDLLEKQDRVFWYNLDVSTVLPIIRNVVEEDTVNMEEKLMGFWAYSVEAGLHTIYALKARRRYC